MKIFDASRDTVRTALNLLLNDGYIQKNKGKGSIEETRFKDQLCKKRNYCSKGNRRGKTIIR